MKFERAVFLAVSLSATLGCVEEPPLPLQEPAEPTTRTMAINGVEAPEATHVFAIRHKNADGSEGYCSSTLIAPNLLLTARHCLSERNYDEEQISFVPCQTALFTETRAAIDVVWMNEPAGVTEGGIEQFPSVASVEVDLSRASMCGYDLGMVILPRNFTAAEAVPLEPRIDVPVVPGETYSMIGYGNGPEDCTTEGRGVRRRIEGLPVTCMGSECPYPGLNLVLGEFFTNAGGTCSGDSGAAAVSEDGRIIGVKVRRALRTADDVSTTMQTDITNNWSEYLRKIGRKAAEQGGYPEPTWVREGSTGELGDSDEDGIADDWDNCPDVDNPEQVNSNDSWPGDDCDPDQDNDGVETAEDNCPEVANEDQEDVDDDGLGDACDDSDDRPEEVDMGAEPDMSAPMGAPQQDEEDEGGCASASPRNPVPGAPLLAFLLGALLLGRRQRQRLEP